jgi:hypothetical protein
MVATQNFDGAAGGGIELTKVEEAQWTSTKSKQNEMHA